MGDIETFGIFVGIGVIAVEALVLFRMQAHVRKVGQLTQRLDSHITHMDKHIDMMDDRVVKIKDQMALVCESVGIKAKK